ncbi:S9 family peptidase OS=Streptomyces rimosus subsp. rimosus (strain ATCC / DSM 40260 / JCM 4667/ NRRL 2234) OX=1265868 GN=SRIM_033520 PE=4 SV=1 [Streptomyces rimosus subsp. rimosus]
MIGIPPAHARPRTVELDTCTGRARVIAARHTDAVDPAYYPEPCKAAPSPARTAATSTPTSTRRTTPATAPPTANCRPTWCGRTDGPTGHAPLVLDLEAAYFTSRGIGVAVVNYGGSTGYGRAYRERLRGQWGVVDVEDCAAVAGGAVADEGTADRRRLAVRGGSAGGWTAAASLVTTGLYACEDHLQLPVPRPGGLVRGRHPRLRVAVPGEPDRPARPGAGPLPRAVPAAPRGPDSAPFLLLQGLDDAVCPPAQCDRFLRAVAGRGTPHAYLAFEGEGHGFRRAETIVRAVETELSLYAQTFGIARTDVPPLELTK